MRTHKQTQMPIRAQKPYHYINAYLNVSDILPQMPNTDFEHILYFNKLNSLEYLDFPQIDDKYDYHQFHIVNPYSTISDVSVYTNPHINQIDHETNVAFDQIGVVLLDEPSTSPALVPEPLLNCTSYSESGVLNLYSVAIDNSQTFAYFGSTGSIVKVNLVTFAIQDNLSVQNPTVLTNNPNFTVALSDPNGEFMYFMTQGGYFIKIDLTTFTIVGELNITDAFSPPLAIYAGVLDSAGINAYFGTYTNNPARIFRIDVRAFNLTGIASCSLQPGEIKLSCALIDESDTYAFFATDTTPGTIIRVDLVNFVRTGAVTLSPGDNNITSAIRDGSYGYFCTYTSDRVIRVDLSILFRTGDLTIPGASQLTTITRGTGDSAYVFYLNGAPLETRVMRIDLVSFSNVVSTLIESSSTYLYTCAVFASTTGRLFAGTTHFTDYTPNRYDRIAQINTIPLDTDTILQLPVGLGMISCGVIDSKGQFAYFAGNTQFSYKTSTAIENAFVYKVDLVSFTVVNRLELQNGDRLVTCMIIDPTDTYVYIGTDSLSVVPGRIVKVDLASFTRLGHLTLKPGETRANCGVSDPSGQFAYFAIYGTSVNQVLGKINLTTPLPTRISELTGVPVGGTIACMSPSGEFAYFVGDGNLRQVFQIDITSGTPTLAATLDLTAFGISGQLSEVMSPDGQTLYIGSSAFPVVFRADLSTGTPILLPEKTQVTGISYNGLMHPSGELSYYISPLPSGNLGVSVVNLDLFQAASYSTIQNLASPAIQRMVMNPNGQYLYWGTNTIPGYLVRMNLNNQLLSGLSNAPFGASDLVNTSEIVDVDFKSQVVKRRVNDQTASKPQYLGLYIRGRTGPQVNLNSYAIHTILKIYPNV